MFSPKYFFMFSDNNYYQAPYSSIFHHDTTVYDKENYDSRQDLIKFLKKSFILITFTSGGKASWKYIMESNCFRMENKLFRVGNIFLINN